MNRTISNSDNRINYSNNDKSNIRIKSLCGAWM